MSLDVDIVEYTDEKDEDGNVIKKVLYTTNITHNLNKIAMECGLYEPLWRPYALFKEELSDYLDRAKTFGNFKEHYTEYEFEQSIKIQCKDIIESVEIGLRNLIANEKELIKYEPDNGWGTYDGLLKFTIEYLRKLHEFPNAYVEVDR